MSWLFCAVWDLSEPVTSLNMWRRNGRVSLVGGTDLLCATFLERHICAFMWLST